MNKLIITITGPSGSGKSTIVKNVIEKIQNICPNIKIKELISHTTRQPRNNEVNGIDYYFICMDEFLRINYVETSFYSGNRYGLSENELSSDFDIGIVVVDKQGKEAIREFCKNNDILCKSLFVKAIPEDCVKRMKERNDSSDKIIERLVNAIKNDEFSMTNRNWLFDFDDYIKNPQDNLEDTVNHTMSKILNWYYEK
jgi:guanylate kinase